MHPRSEQSSSELTGRTLKLLEANILFLFHFLLSLGSTLGAPVLADAGCAIEDICEHLLLQAQGKFPGQRPVSEKDIKEVGQVKKPRFLVVESPVSLILVFLLSS